MQGKKRFIQLTATEQAALEEGRKTGSNATFRQRCHYILLSHQGYSVKSIAEIYTVQTQTIIRWYNRYESAGIAGLHTAKGKGRPPILRIDNEAESKKIEAIVDKSSQNLKKAISEIEKELGKTMCKRTLKRYLKKKIGDGNALEKNYLTNQRPRN